MKKFLAVIIFIFSSILATAQNSSKSKNWDFSLSHYTGLSCGNLGEYLYSQYDKDFAVSDLQWNYILWNAGLKADYRYKNFFIDGDFTYFAPFSCGKMYDSDYNTDFKTNYVNFDNNNLLSIRGEVNFRYTFDVYKTDDLIFSILPVIKGIYSYNNFSGKNGKGYLGDSDNPETSLEYDVPWNSDIAEYHEFYDIDYERMNFYTFAGLNFKFKKNKSQVFGGFYISPFTFAIDKDFHHGTPDNEYISYCYNFCYFNRFLFDAGFSIELNKALQFFTEATILSGTTQKGAHITNRFRGDTFGPIFSKAEYSPSSQDKGMDIFDFTLKVGVRYSFAK